MYGNMFFFFVVCNQCVILYVKVGLEIDVQFVSLYCFVVMLFDGLFDVMNQVCIVIQNQNIELKNCLLMCVVCIFDEGLCVGLDLFVGQLVIDLCEFYGYVCMCLIQVNLCIDFVVVQECQCLFILVCEVWMVIVGMFVVQVEGVVCVV